VVSSFTEFVIVILANLHNSSGVFPSSSSKQAENGRRDKQIEFPLQNSRYLPSISIDPS
jgi:hypothetical protein